MIDMNKKYEKFIEYVVNDLIKSSAKYVHVVPVGRWEENSETKRMEFMRYNREDVGISFEPLEMLALRIDDILNDDGDFNYELNHYIEEHFGVKRFSNETDYIIKKYVDKVFELKDTLPVVKK